MIRPIFQLMKNVIATEKIRVNYEGKETPVRAYYAKPSDREFRPGTYFIDIYEQGGKLIGQTSVDLR